MITVLLARRKTVCAGGGYWSTVRAVDGEDGYFGERVAAGYDQSCAEMFAPDVLDETIGVLAELADGGPALELGIGTGRVALPLARRGIAVHGIDMSRAMAARLRAKPDGDAIGVTIGDFATTRVEGTFGLAYLVFKSRWGGWNREPFTSESRQHVSVWEMP
jgi:SAM-dependent methyltransferase